ncbi:MAG TPA: TatD family hydrolase, partial [Armatimonadota bacterium]|nr:TatD family hydrolase [Armatimonadota bacterium]
MLIDSHCHLDYYVEAEIDAVIARAREAGVARMVTIGTRFAQAAAVKALAERFPDTVWGMVGIGESGLDYFYDKAPRAVQHEGFRRHIRA